MASIINTSLMMTMDEMTTFAQLRAVCGVALVSLIPDEVILFFFFFQEEKLDATSRRMKLAVLASSMKSPNVFFGSPLRSDTLCEFCFYFSHQRMLINDKNALLYMVVSGKKKNTLLYMAVQKLLFIHGRSITPYY